MATPKPAAKKVLPVEAASATAKAPATAKAANATKVKKPAPVAVPKREKLVRDSFTIPKSEYDVLGALKLRANALAVPAKKSELLRAGIKALAAMKDAPFLAALQGVPAIKTGRPATEAPAKKAGKAKDAGSPRTN